MPELKFYSLLNNICSFPVYSFYKIRAKSTKCNLLLFSPILCNFFMSRNTTRARFLELVTNIIGAGSDDLSSDIIHPSWHRTTYENGTVSQIFGGEMPNLPILTKRWPRSCVSTRLKTVTDCATLSRDEFIHSGLAPIEFVKF